MSYDGAFWSPIIKHLILQSDVKKNVLFLVKFVMRFCKISAFLDQFSTNVPLLHPLITYPLKPEVCRCFQGWKWVNLNIYLLKVQDFLARFWFKILELTHFQQMFHFYTAWKHTRWNRRFSDVFRRHRSGTLVENGLISLLQLLIAIEWKNYKLRKNVITKELNRVNCFF